MIARFLDIDFTGLTVIPHDQLSVGYLVYHATEALARSGDSYVTWENRPVTRPRGRRRLRGPEVEAVQDEVQAELDAGAPSGSGTQTGPTIQSVLDMLGDMQLEHRYEFGALGYRSDHAIYNQELLARGFEDVYPAVYHRPPHYGQPDTTLPYPDFDRGVADQELEHHRDYARSSSYRQDQEDWMGGSHATVQHTWTGAPIPQYYGYDGASSSQQGGGSQPQPGWGSWSGQQQQQGGDRQQSSVQDWLFQDPFQSRPRDYDQGSQQDPSHRGGWFQ